VDSRGTDAPTRAHQALIAERDPLAGRSRAGNRRYGRFGIPMLDSTSQYRTERSVPLPDVNYGPWFSTRHSNWLLWRPKSAASVCLMAGGCLAQDNTPSALCAAATFCCS